MDDIDILVSRLRAGGEPVTASRLIEAMNSEVSKEVEAFYSNLSAADIPERECQLANFSGLVESLASDKDQDTAVTAMLIGEAYGRLCMPSSTDIAKGLRDSAAQIDRKIGRLVADKKNVDGRALLCSMAAILWGSDKQESMSTGSVAKEITAIIDAAYHDKSAESLTTDTSAKLLKLVKDKYSKDQLKNITRGDPESLRKNLRNWSSKGLLSIPPYAERPGRRT